MSRYPELSLEFLTGLFRMDANTGRLFWENPPKNHPRMLGKEAGSLRETRNGKKYCRIKINGIPYLRSRIIFCMANGRWPSDQIDHVNGNSIDDRPTNLREATYTENNRNIKHRNKENNLPMGVKKLSESIFGARIGYLGTSIWLGSFSSASEAESEYRSMRKKLFGEFA